jgi:hypothetical protein
MLKTSLMLTLITGSSAAGKVFPSHIQLQLKAKSAGTAQIDIGCKEVKSWPSMYGTNEKGGMDNEEFTKYMQDSIAPLFPYALNQHVITSCSRLTVGQAG